MHSRYAKIYYGHAKPHTSPALALSWLHPCVYTDRPPRPSACHLKPHACMLVPALLQNGTACGLLHVVEPKGGRLQLLLADVHLWRPGWSPPGLPCLALPAFDIWGRRDGTLILNPSFQ